MSIRQSASLLKKIMYSPPQILDVLFPNPLDTLARKYGTDKSSLGHNYTHYYFRYFNNIRHEVESILEIGVREGWSHKMWHDFFPRAAIYGIENYEDGLSASKEAIENDRIKIFVGDQADEQFLIKNFSDKLLDIVIDDGGHRMSQQQISLKVLYRFLKPKGIYVIEDLHTSMDRYFWDIDNYKTTTLYALRSYQKSGQIHSYYFSEDDKTYFSDNTQSVKIFRDKICFIEKK